MEEFKLEIVSTAARLCAYTARAAGVAVLAHTDAATADLFVDGSQYNNVLSDSAPTKGTLLQLRARSAKYYIFFDLLGPMSPELFAEIGEQYSRLVQARLDPGQMEELFAQEN